MITKKEWIKLVSKVDQTFEDEFKGEFNSPELIYPLVKRLLKQCSVKRSLPKMKCSCDLQLKFCKTPSLCVSDVLGNDA